MLLSVQRLDLRVHGWRVSDTLVRSAEDPVIVPVRTRAGRLRPNQDLGHLDLSGYDHGQGGTAGVEHDVAGRAGQQG